MKQNNYVEKRVSEQKEYFSTVARKNKKYYYSISLIKIILTTFVAVLSSILSRGAIGLIIISIIAALTVILDSVIILFKFNENWINYRTINEEIKREEVFYRYNSGKYFGLSENERENLFIQNIEGIIQNATEKWKKLNSEKNDEKAPK